jgi:putative transposase
MFNKWPAEFGGMDTSMMARMKELEEADRHLKKMNSEENLQAKIANEHLPQN